jgi:LysM repeat protein
MNSKHTLSPETSTLEPKGQGRARVKVAVFSVLAVHVAGLMALLMTQGCKRAVPPESQAPEPPLMDTNAIPTADTNAVPMVDTNAFVNPVPSTPVVPETVAAVTSEYIVVKGDSFYTIAKAHGITVKAIEAANPGVDARKLKIGQKLVLPPAGAAPAMSATAVAPEPTGETVYTVKSGDNLLKIAQHNGTTVKAIKALNGLTTDQIKVGQKLKLPAKVAPAPAPVAPTLTEPAPAPAPDPAPVR